MSMIDRWGDKVVLQRIGPDDFWKDVRAFYAGDEMPRWRNLAMLALHVNAGWSLEMIAHAFGLERGSVSRALTRLRADLQEHFEWVPEIDVETPDPQAQTMNAVSNP